MKKHYMLILLACSFSIAAEAQLQSQSYRITNDFPQPVVASGNVHSRGINNPKTCGNDTIDYAKAKASAYNTVSVSKGRALGQFFSAPQKITISGFSFYALVAANPPSPKKMRVICNLYKANSDSLPSGSPLRSDTITIDSTFGGGLLSKLEKKARFKTPITMDSGYVLTVESDSANLTAAVVCNSWVNGDGEKERLNSGSINNIWYRGFNLNISGVTFDADIVLEPHVSYTFGNDFTIKNQCFNITDSIKFINSVKNNVSGSRMYNRYVYYGLDWFCHYWNYGDNSGNYYQVDAKKKYAGKGNYNVMLVSTVYGYRNFSSCVDTTVKTLKFMPVRPSCMGPANVCIGDSATYTAVGDTGVVFEWLKTPSSQPFHKGTTYTKKSITVSDTFYLRASNGTCVSPLRMFIITANSYPGGLTTLNDSVCSGSKANLKANSNKGVIEWYTDPNGGAPVFAGTVFQTPVLTADTFYYVQANNNGCISPGGRVKVSAFVGANYAPQPPVLTADTTVCLSATPSVTLTGNGGSNTVRWFDQPSGSTPINTGNTFVFFPIKKEIRTYYADAWNGVCGSSRIPVNVTIEDNPNILVSVGDTICSGDSAVLTASSDFGNINWYDASSGGNLIFSGNKFVSLNHQNNITYYLETESNGCISPVRKAISITANTFAPVTNISAPAICAKNQAQLSASVAFGNLHWYDSDTASKPSGSGSTYITEILNGNKTFYVQSENKGCPGPKMPVIAIVKPAPFSGFQYQLKPNRVVNVSPINAGASSILWDFDDGTKSTSNTVNHQYTSNGTYNIKLILTSLQNGCKDSTTIPVTIDNTDIRTPSLLSRVTLYPNPSKGTINLNIECQAATKVPLYIHDMAGKQVYSKPLELRGGMNTITVDSGLSNGMYILSLDKTRIILLIGE